MLKTTIAGSLPKPFWLAQPEMLWAPWQQPGDRLAEAKRDATLLWIKEQEMAGLDIVGDGEQSRQHFVRGFLERIEGIDFQNKVKMGIRDNRYEADVPTVTEKASLESVIHWLQRGGAPMVGVLDRDQRFLGYITSENVGELLMIRKLRRPDPQRA